VSPIVYLVDTLASPWHPWHKYNSGNLSLFNKLYVFNMKNMSNNNIKINININNNNNDKIIPCVTYKDLEKNKSLIYKENRNKSAVYR
jgi:hypothetical protein